MTPRRRTTPTAEEAKDDSPKDKWIHSLAKKSLRTDIILGKATANCVPDAGHARILLVHQKMPTWLQRLFSLAAEASSREELTQVYEDGWKDAKEWSQRIKKRERRIR
jgi:hypothetical protein